MSPVIYAPGAIRDLQRLQEFWRPKNPVAARRAADTIMKAMQMLALSGIKMIDGLICTLCDGL